MIAGSGAQRYGCLADSCRRLERYATVEHLARMVRAAPRVEHSRRGPHRVEHERVGTELNPADLGRGGMDEGVLGG